MKLGMTCEQRRNWLGRHVPPKKQMQLYRNSGHLTRHRGRCPTTHQLITMLSFALNAAHLPVSFYPRRRCSLSREICRTRLMQAVTSCTAGVASACASASAQQRAGGAGAPGTTLEVQPCDGRHAQRHERQCAALVRPRGVLIVPLIRGRGEPAPHCM